MPSHHSLASIDILAIFDTLPFGIALTSLTGQMLHCNKALAALLEVDAAQVKGVPCRHVLRARPCVAGCLLGCKAFGTKAGSQTTDKHITVSELTNIFSMTQYGIETDILTQTHKKIPIRLTHMPVLDDQKSTLFYLDVIEDLSELKALEHRIHHTDSNNTFVGKSTAIERILGVLPHLASSDAPVFITGETGTGKDLLAETLHKSSYRSRDPFIRISIMPMAEDLLHEELFGSTHYALQGKTGRFQQAVGGTLYITELADIPKSIQSKLICFLDEGAITPMGTSTPVPVNARLVAATNRRPEMLIENDILLPELYYRLNLGHLHIPPLRERPEDTDFLLEHFLAQYAKRFKKHLVGFSKEVRAMLAYHTYPGNIRELRNIVEYAAMVCRKEEVDLESMPSYLLLSAPTQKQTSKTQPPATKKKRHGSS